MKSVLFRADATPSVGAGHVMRCIALAQEFQKQGVKVTFLTKTTFPWLSEYLASQAFQVHAIAVQEKELGRELDLKATLEAAKNSDWVVLDNYYFAGAFQKALQSAGKHLLLVDDLPEREFHADLILNHGMGADVVKYPGLMGTKLLLGSKYALIRSDLRANAASLRPKSLNNILITLGGGDHTEVLKKWVQAFDLLHHLNLNVKALAFFSSPGIEIIPPSPDAYKLYEWADLAVCAGGGTVSELCFFGIPGVVGALAENQEPNVKSLAQKGIFDSVGNYAKASPDELASAVRKLVTNPARVEEMRQKAKKLVDGQGAHRVYQAMQEVACEVH